MGKTKLNQTNNISGTSFGFCIYASAYQLIDAFGEPHYEDSDVSEKVSIEWDFETEDGVVFTIYDWKEYDEPACDNKEKIYSFHIGIKSRVDSWRVREILEEYGF